MQLVWLSALTRCTQFTLTSRSPCAHAVFSCVCLAGGTKCKREVVSFRVNWGINKIYRAFLKLMTASNKIIITKMKLSLYLSQLLQFYLFFFSLHWPTYPVLLLTDLNRHSEYFHSICSASWNSTCFLQGLNLCRWHEEALLRARRRNTLRSL